MLKDLYIKNLAVVDELKLAFDSGFHVLTGETGAGKSILMEAVSLILGQKTATDLVRDGCDEAIVEASFDITDFPEAHDLLKVHDLLNADDGNELVIRRVVSREGKGKITINYQRASLLVLQTLSASLIDFTGQFASVSLLSGQNDMTVFDAFLLEPAVKTAYQKQYREVVILKKRLDDCKNQEAQKTQRLDWIAFQLSDLEKIKERTPDAEETFKTARERLKNQNLIAQFSQTVTQVMTDGEGNIVSLVQALRGQLDRQEALRLIFSPLGDLLDALRASAEEASFQVSKLGSSSALDLDLSLDDIESRLFLMSQLKKKYGPTWSDVLKKYDELLVEKQSLENRDEDSQRLMRDFDREFTVLKKMALDLSKMRQAIRGDVEKRVIQELQALHMPHVTFQVVLHLANTGDDFPDYTEVGLDHLSFLLSPNPGLKPRPLSEIASGGEMSRIFLALKRVLSRHRHHGTMIFDEIDTGISGGAVELVGQRLKDLASRFQVFCVTHHAQIASLADRHFFVEKEVTPNKTVTRVKTLGAEERIREVARLMGGMTITKKNLDFAREILSAFPRKTH
jgi:DNA repair protein RecN (Recombination protein N)